MTSTHDRQNDSGHPDDPSGDAARKGVASSPDRGSRGRSIRVSLAVVIVIAAAAFAAASYWVEPLRVCRPGNEGAESCAPWGFAELIPSIVVAIALLLPDIGEMSVGNLLVLKRRVDLQESEIRSTTSRQDALERQILTQVSSVESNQHVTQNFYHPGLSATDLPEAIHAKAVATSDGDDSRTGLRPPESEQDGGGPDDIPADQDDDIPPTSRVTLEDEIFLSDYGPRDAMRALQLIDEWEYLRNYLEPRLPYSVNANRSRRVVDLWRERFRRLYDDEISVVRSVRNSIAHGMYVPPDHLKGALIAARELVRIMSTTPVKEFGIDPSEL